MVSVVDDHLNNRQRVLKNIRCFRMKYIDNCYPCTCYEYEVRIFYLMMMTAQQQNSIIRKLNLSNECYLQQLTCNNFAFKIVIVSLCNFYLNKIANHQFLFIMNHHFIIHFNTIKFCTAQISTGFFFIDDHF